MMIKIFHSLKSSLMINLIELIMCILLTIFLSI